ncbi:PilZ domain-containing protein [Vibrio sp. 99-70-13A1]|uniref:PilZ domain-containing protein n=1 Tax=Vibrio sp. 99-70-13A1 TaxID=2607601 RepID=UPI0014935537|nr:PilZ domain-containing protein [Vibrio sp. 99-70-13A1]NOH96712.1 PilZ domain-containing protein [Vibrio sp. 99-70-13A1]
MTEQEYFTVHHSLTANIEPMGSEFVLPSQIQFEAEIPAPFVVASEFSQLDLLADNARIELKNSDLKNVISLLDTQNSKLNLLLSFMLAQQDDEQFRTHTYTFGASLFSCYSAQPLQAGEIVKAKLFLEYPAAAIYCYAQVLASQEKDSGFEINFKYELLRDTDQDLLIKAALHQQQKLLRQRSLDRDNK